MGLYQVKWPEADSTTLVVVRLADRQFGDTSTGNIPPATAQVEGVAPANEDLPFFESQDLLKANVLARYTISYTKAGRRRSKSFILPNRGAILTALQALTSFDGGTDVQVTNTQGRRKSNV